MQPFYLLSEYAASKPKCRVSIASCSEVEVELVVTARALRYASPAPLPPPLRPGPARIRNPCTPVLIATTPVRPTEAPSQPPPTSRGHLTGHRPDLQSQTLPNP